MPPYWGSRTWHDYFVYIIVGTLAVELYAMALITTRLIGTSPYGSVGSIMMILVIMLSLTMASLVFCALITDLTDWFQ